MRERERERDRDRERERERERVKLDILATRKRVVEPVLLHFLSYAWKFLFFSL